jgi:hypothetical protein
MGVLGALRALGPGAIPALRFMRPAGEGPGAGQAEGRQGSHNLVSHLREKVKGFKPLVYPKQVVQEACQDSQSLEHTHGAGHVDIHVYGGPQASCTE